MKVKKNMLTDLRLGFISLMLVFSQVIYAEDSKYLETIDYPAYDSRNPDHVLIDSNADWAKINGPAHYYYVKPGDYRGVGKVDLSAKGTASKKRYIILGTAAYSKDAAHPGKLNSSTMANVWLSFNGGGSYWVIDRMATVNIETKAGTTVWQAYHFQNGASHNILNRILLKDYYYGIVLGDGTNYNTIQKARLDTMKFEARKMDKVAIALASEGNDNVFCYGNKILDCEIKDANDGIQLVRSNWSRSRNVQFDGTIVDNNKIWISPATYMNAAGQFDPNGDFASAENGLDWKSGSYDPNNPVVFTNNKIWGTRFSKTGGDAGYAVSSHAGAYNVVFEDNIVFDSAYAISLSTVRDNDLPLSNKNWSIKRNIFYQVNKTNPDGRHQPLDVSVQQSANIQIEDNILVDSPGYKAYYLIPDKGNNTFKRNVTINSGQVYGNGNIVSADNFTYGSSNNLPNNTAYANASDAKMGDLTITYDVYTNDPKQKTLYGVVTTSQSPHANIVNAPRSVSFSTSNVNESSSFIEPEEPKKEVTGPWIMDFDKNELR